MLKMLHKHVMKTKNTIFVGVGLQIISVQNLQLSHQKPASISVL